MPYKDDIKLDVDGNTVVDNGAAQQDQSHGSGFAHGFVE